MSSRLFPALDVRPAAPPLDPEAFQGTVLASLDEGAVTALVELAGGWRLFFSSPEARDRARSALAALGPEGLSLAPLDVPDEDWARRSQENLTPVQVGRVRLSPPWAAGGAGTLLEVIIQPSMGFGTGHHATTRLCTALLQQLDLAGRSVLDIGTGSGVLALVALRLGAWAVLAIDDDGDALEAARENLDLNGVTTGIELRKADFRTLPPARFDLVTANLTGGLLARGAAEILAALAPGAGLILSGITLDEEADVRACFDPELRLGARLEEDGWIGVRYETWTLKTAEPPGQQ